MDDRWKLEAFLSRFHVNMDGFEANLAMLSRHPAWVINVEYDVRHMAYRMSCYHKAAGWCFQYMLTEQMHYEIRGEIPLHIPFPKPAEGEKTYTVMEHLQKAEQLLDRQLNK